MPPQTNATLTRIGSATAATGGRDDWDEPAGEEPAGADAAKWTGAAGAYYTEHNAFTPGLGGADRTATRALIVDSSVARAAGVDTDDVVTFMHAGGQVVSRVTGVAIRELAGIPVELQTARLELEAA